VVVDVSGVVLHQQGGASVTHPSTGVYNVDFGTDVSACGYFGQNGDDGTGPVGLVRMHASGSNPDVVVVNTFRVSSSQVLDDYPFNLSVFC
jgi:hypothetical protein